jgi:hypothetical protein
LSAYPRNRFLRAAEATGSLLSFLTSGLRLAMKVESGAERASITRRWRES